MITEIKISNFKAIGKELPIKIKPLTIFVGPNGSGKSTILEAMALMAQSVRSQLNFNGYLVRYPSPSSIFHKSDVRNPIGLGLSIKLDEHELSILNQKLRSASIPSLTSGELRYEFSWLSHVTASSDILQRYIINTNNTLIELSRKFVDNSRYVISGEIPIYGVQCQPAGNIDNFLPFFAGQMAVVGTGRPQENQFNDLMYYVNSLFEKRLFQKIFLLYSTRGKINYSSPANADSSWIGIEGEFIIQILAKIFSRAEYREMAKTIAKWTEKFGIYDLTAGWMGANILESSYVDQELNTNLNVAVSGFGSRQALAMIVQLFWSKGGDTLLIEEPEISLHPTAQVHLPELFADVIKQQKNLVVTTHSEFLILALSRPIKAGLLKIDDVVVYNVEKTSDGTKIRELKLSPNGYIEGWIPSFTKVESELMKEFLQSVPTE